MQTMPTSEEMQARLDALRSGGELSASEASTDVSLPATLLRQPNSICDSLISALRVEDGIGTGLGEIDTRTRGFRPTDLVIVTGFAHSGKTQLVNTMILRNPDKRVLFISLDDPAEMILAKLVAMHEGIGAEVIERRLREGDDAVEALIRKVSEEHLSSLRIVDENIGIPRMQQVVEEASEDWGERPHAVVIDYIEMMSGDGRYDDGLTNVRSKTQALKKWAKHADFPIVALHQGTRTNAKPGHPITMLSLAFAGEQEGTIIIGVRRKRDNADLDGYERNTHQHTVTLHIVKNKRPGGRCTAYDGVDYYMDEATGLIRELRNGDLLATRTNEVRAVDTASEAAQHAGTTQSALWFAND